MSDPTVGTYVSYACPNGFGGCVITSNGPIESIADIDLARHFIAIENDLSDDDVVILSFHPLKSTMTVEGGETLEGGDTTHRTESGNAA